MAQLVQGLRGAQAIAPTLPFRLPAMRGAVRARISPVASLALAAFVTSVAYMDPGNVATNIQGGAAFGYKLLWVVVLANLAAMLFQALSARLGIVSGMNLAELIREHLPMEPVAAIWVLSEIAAMATGLAELLGAGIGVHLLFHIPLLAATLVAGLATYATLLLQRWVFASSNPSSQPWLPSSAAATSSRPFSRRRIGAPSPTTRWCPGLAARTAS
jgi:hypothetical protein